MAPRSAEALATARGRRWNGGPNKVCCGLRKVWKPLDLAGQGEAAATCGERTSWRRRQKTARLPGGERLRCGRGTGLDSPWARGTRPAGQPRVSDLSRSHRKFGQAEAEADCVPQHDEQRVPID